jgi:hypothetical protein
MQQVGAAAAQQTVAPDPATAGTAGGRAYWHYNLEPFPVDQELFEEHYWTYDKQLALQKGKELSEADGGECRRLARWLLDIKAYRNNHLRYLTNTQLERLERLPGFQWEVMTDNK